MKKIIYMAMTVNAMIAQPNDDTPWSEEEWNNFNLAAKKAGNIVIGMRTYELMRDSSSFDKLQDIFVVVVTSGKEVDNERFNFVHSPQDAIDLLNKRGFKVAMIAGGRNLNSSMIKEHLVDEIYLDVEPKIFAKGISLFSEDVGDLELKLIGSTKIGDNTIQLHYRII